MPLGTPAFSPRSIDPASGAGLVRPVRELLHDRIGGPTRPDGEMDLRVVLEIIGEDASSLDTVEQIDFESTHLRAVDEIGAVRIEQVVELGGQLVGAGAVHTTPSCAIVRRTHSNSERRIRLSELWTLCADRPLARATSRIPAERA